MTVELTETEIQNQIFDYLLARRVMCWMDKQPKKKPGKGTRKRSNGVADILGIYHGKPLAVEVKRPRGELSMAQWEFLEGFRKAGGIVIVATCVEDVTRGLAGQ